MKLTREIRLRLTESVDSYRQQAFNSWSGWPDVEGIVPFVVVQATFVGPVQPETGYVCEVKTIDTALRQAVAACVKSDGLPRSVSLFIALLWQQLESDTALPTRLVALEIAASPYFRFRKTQESPTMVFVTQQYEFSAAHRLHCPELSEKENQTLFGKCNNLNGHGHNYVLDVCLECTPDAAGQLFLLAEMDKTVRHLVIDRFDHRHLNKDTEEFSRRNPTVENIAEVIFGLLDGKFAAAQLANIRLYETPKTWVDVSAADRKA
jgi:6-pyruvoyltetrahydropterin/6-carboxytetrahydropterin synthase